MLMGKLNKIIQRIILLTLFAAALNLSFHANVPTKIQEILSSHAYIDEQEFIFIPFGEKETTNTSQPVSLIQTLSFPSFNNHLNLLQKSKFTMELFYRLNLNAFKEYPFIVFVRKLRI